jgi:hypothetical protein
MQEFVQYGRMYRAIPGVGPGTYVGNFPGGNFMKRMVVFTGFILMFALAVWAAPKSSKMTGWVSDAMCGAKGANANHMACAKKCAAGGEKVVFVTDNDKKVMQVANQDSLKDHAGQHVSILASTNSDGSLQVDKVTPMK